MEPERLGPQEVTPSPGCHFSGGQVQLEACILEGREKRRFIYLCSHCQFQKRTKKEAECHENTQTKLGENGKAGFPRRRRRVRRWRRNRSQAPAKMSHRQKGCIKKLQTHCYAASFPRAARHQPRRESGVWNWAQFQGASVTQLSHLQDGKNGTAPSGCLKEILGTIYKRAL